ncbi:MAG: enoyl-CoA hydratase [Rhodospirillaceae bacterium]|nr:enoyl-CoA hydratase [Rhodospirillaceae bacterium]|tara:strand:+ start:96 stop:866 length:771 start_codon:yes stop_codon:yes gene_type:complete
MTDHIQTEINDGVLEIRMNRPKKKNALTPEMYSALADALLGADDDRRIRVVWITGMGDAFTSGNDINSFIREGRDADSGLDADRFLPALATVETPFIAAVNGMAIGIGSTMLLHCDMVHATENASFCFPFTNLGIFPEAASTMVLPFIAGHQKAMELFLMGERFDLETACDAGMINHVFAPEDLEAESLAIAKRLAQKPARALRITKRLVRRGYPDLVKAMEEESPLFTEMMHAPEAQEAFNAFLEKRKPDFSQFD